MAASFAGRGVTGFGLANDESGWPPEPFAEAFAIARDAGLMSVPHGGELEGPESVIGCLDSCGAHRVMHGVRAVESPDLMRRLAEEEICLDVCPSSNLALGVVAAIPDHPLPELLAAGIRCTINADDPLLFGPGILEEYQLCRDELDLDDVTLARIATWSLESSAAPASLITSARSRIDTWLNTSPGSVS
jgi:adenosine deaminase